MKKILIKWLLPVVIDLVIDVLEKLALKSDNAIDDRLVNVIRDNKANIISEIENKL